jgi:hypothetical protein
LSSHSFFRLFDQERKGIHGESSCSDSFAVLLSTLGRGLERSEACMIILTNSDKGELAFRPRLETVIGDTVTQWEWGRLHSRRHHRSSQAQLNEG